MAVVLGPDAKGFPSVCTLMFVVSLKKYDKGTKQLRELPYISDIALPISSASVSSCTVCTASVHKHLVVQLSGKVSADDDICFTTQQPDQLQATFARLNNTLQQAILSIPITSLRYLENVLC